MGERWEGVRCGESEKGREKGAGLEIEGYH